MVKPAVLLFPFPSVAMVMPWPWPPWPMRIFRPSGATRVPGQNWCQMGNHRVFRFHEVVMARPHPVEKMVLRDSTRV